MKRIAVAKAKSEEQANGFCWINSKRNKHNIINNIAPDRKSNPLRQRWPASRSRSTGRSQAIKWSIPSYQVIDRKNIICDYKDYKCEVLEVKTGRMFAD